MVCGIAPCCRLFVAVIEVVPVIDPTVAVTVAVPAVRAVKVTGFAGFGEKLPSAGEIDQVGVTDTVLPKRSRPVALNEIRLPTRTWAPAGVTAIVASGAAVTVSVWVALPYPLALAVSTGCPARVSV